MHGTNHVVELAEERAPNDGEDDCAQKRADETLNCLLWRELDERGAAHSDTTNVRKYVIADDEGRGDKEPDETFKKVVYDEVAENRVRQSPTALFIDSYLETTMSRSVICTQQNRPNCCLR